MPLLLWGGGGGGVRKFFFFPPPPPPHLFQFFSVVSDMSQQTTLWSPPGAQSQRPLPLKASTISAVFITWSPNSSSFPCVIEFNCHVQKSRKSRKPRKESKEQHLFYLYFQCIFLSIFSKSPSRYHYRWRASNFDLCSALMTIEQWGFFSVPHLVWYGTSVYNGHLRGPVTLTPIAIV